VSAGVYVQLLKEIFPTLYIRDRTGCILLRTEDQKHVTRCNTQGVALPSTGALRTMYTTRGMDYSV